MRLVIGNKNYLSWSMRPWPLTRRLDGETRVWDSLAILEWLAERFPRKRVWPAAPGARAFALSVSAEMHSMTPMRDDALLGDPVVVYGIDRPTSK